MLNKGKFFKQYAVLEWPPAHARKTVAKSAPAPKIVGKVTDKISWLNGTRVTFMEKGYISSTHWIADQYPGLHPALRVRRKSAQKPPGGGIRLTPDALDELDAMLAKGDPVTLE